MAKWEIKDGAMAESLRAIAEQGGADLLKARFVERVYFTLARAGKALTVFIDRRPVYCVIAFSTSTPGQGEVVSVHNRDPFAGLDMHQRIGLTVAIRKRLEAWMQMLLVDEISFEWWNSRLAANHESRRYVAALGFRESSIDGIFTKKLEA